MPPLNFGPEVQYFNEFLKKDYMLFVFIVIQNEKVFFFCKIKWLVAIPRPALHEPFVQDDWGLRELSPLSVLKC